MNYKNIISDSGSYVNGQYYTKNGFTGSGLNCPRGTSLYDTSVIPGIFFEPEDKLEGEEFEAIMPYIVPDISPYYAISNYGRVYNFKTGLIMKENYRPNGYGYYCFATTAINPETGKIKQRKGTTHRMVMETFEPNPERDRLEVNHIDGNKKNNTYNVHLNDGTILNNLEWVTPEENIKHAIENGLRPNLCNNNYRRRMLTMDEARDVRRMHNEGYTIEQIMEKYPLSMAGIQHIYNNITYKEK